MRKNTMRESKGKKDLPNPFIHDVNSTSIQRVDSMVTVLCSFKHVEESLFSWICYFSISVIGNIPFSSYFRQLHFVDCVKRKKRGLIVSLIQSMEIKDLPLNKYCPNYVLHFMLISIAFQEDV